VDFGSGENQFKRLLSNDFREQGDFWFPMTARGRLVTTLTRTLDVAFRGGKQLLQGTTVVQRIKRYVRSTKNP
jgi:CelD/BcsL family acetyltransferase involved in cellulose biosynthesis